MSTPRKLRLISFDPEELQASELILKASGELISDPLEIGSVFSLFFLWPGEGRVYLPGKGKDARALELELVPPTLMSEIDYVYFRVLDYRPEHFLRAGNILTFFAEIFQTSYRFEAEVFEVKSTETGSPIYAVHPPHELRVQKLRRLPRISLGGASPSSNAKMRPVENVAERGIGSERIGEGRSVGGTVAGAVAEVMEIGADSFVVDFVDEPSVRFEKGSEWDYAFGGSEGKAHFLRRSDEHFVFQIRPQTFATGKSYFDFYRTVRFPKVSGASRLERIGTGTEVNGTVVAGEGSGANPRENWLLFSVSSGEPVGLAKDSGVILGRLLLEIETLLVRQKELDLTVVFSPYDSLTARLWNKFCQESKSHRRDFPMSIESPVFSSVKKAFEESHADASAAKDAGFQFVRLSEKDLLQLYSSVQHLGIVLDETGKKRRAG